MEIPQIIVVYRRHGAAPTFRRPLAPPPLISPHYYLFYVAIQIIGKYLLFINCLLSIT